MEPKIVFEDDCLIILDKPAGWIVNEANTTKDTPVVQSWIAKDYKFETAKSKEYRSGIVHRLDKETSGVLIIAKTKDAFTKLQRQFKKRKVKKEYVALAHGVVEPKEDTIKVPVGRLSWNRERFGVVAGGRSAETRYKVVGKYIMPKSKDSFSLLSLFPKTGRTHQIRIHLKYVGHPIVADDFYAGRKTSRRDRKWCPRLFLHAAGITFSHPESKKQVSYKSDIPVDLKEALSTLKEA
jgi:23S rRNA pseudouridine1911/1915/1917 synthase